MTGVIGLCSGDESAQHAADRLGVCRPTLYDCKEQYGLGNALGISVVFSHTDGRIP